MNLPKPPSIMLEPINDRVVVQRLEAKQQGLIVIPDGAVEKGDQGVVLAVGPGLMLPEGKRSTLTVKPGDLVLMGKYSGQTLKVDNVEIMVMREDDIFAIIPKTAE